MRAAFNGAGKIYDFKDKLNFENGHWSHSQFELQYAHGIYTVNVTAT